MTQLRSHDGLSSPIARCRRIGVSSSSSLSVFLLLCLIVALLSFCSLGASGQQVRIPLKRVDVSPGHHPTRSAAHIARQLAATQPHHQAHSTISFATDPSIPVSLKNYFNRMYTGAVSVGTPSKEYSLVFDTGSADMWLFAAAATATKLSYVNYYDSSASSTSKTTTTPWSIQYGKGSASGHLVSDAVSLAGKTANDFTFAEATTWSDEFESADMPLDGLLGLAFSAVSSANSLTLIDALQQQGKIKDRVFSFYLSTDSEGSQMVLGAPDLSLAGGGNLTYMDLASTGGMWLLSMQGVYVGSTTTSYCSSADCAVLLDTGTSFIGMPNAAFLDFASKVQAARSDCLVDSGSGLIRCDRNTAAGLPTLSFSLQGNLFTLQASDYFQQGVLGLMSIDVGSKTSLWILGDTFLKTYYTVFDMDQRRIGIVGAKPGLPFSKSDGESDSPYRRFTWQLVVVIAAALLGFCIITTCCIRCCQNKEPRQRQAPLAGGGGGVRRDSGVVAAGATPYMLHQMPPTFESQSYQQQPAANGYPGATPAAGARGGRPAGNSDFSRDFYAVQA